MKTPCALNFARWILTLSSIISVGACGKLPWDHNKDSDTPNQTPQTQNQTPQNSPSPTPLPQADDLGYTGPIQNLNTLLEQTGLSPWHHQGGHGQEITIGILDNGFAGLTKSMGSTLPPGLVVGKSSIQNQGTTAHGTKLAEIITALTSGSAKWRTGNQTPRLKLYNSNGFTNFAAAVDQAIADRVDIILYSQVWDFGGNFDGTGFINQVVNKAMDSGILWINAAGNYGLSTWQGLLTANHDSSARLPWKDRYIRLLVTQDDTPIKLTLSWNDFTDSKDSRTNKDLNLSLLDSQEKILETAQKIQDGQNHGADQAYSAYPRETITTRLSRGEYLIRVDFRSNNFDRNSKIRIAADGPGISFVDRTPEASMMIPADNPRVIAVGANDDPSSARGQTEAGILKPEILSPSIVEYRDGFKIQGSSTAAAVAAAAAAIYMDRCGIKSRNDLITGLMQKPQRPSNKWMPQGSPKLFLNRCL